MGSPSFRLGSGLFGTRQQPCNLAEQRIYQTEPERADRQSPFMSVIVREELLVESTER